MYILTCDAGNCEKETDSSQDKKLTKNDKGVHQNQDMIEGEYKYPLVWIDLEMTGIYFQPIYVKTSFGLEFFNNGSYV